MSVLQTNPAKALDVNLLGKAGRTSAATTRFGCGCICSGKSADALLGAADVRHGHRGPSAAAQHTYDPAAASSHPPRLLSEFNGLRWFRMLFHCKFFRVTVCASQTSADPAP